MAYHSRDGDALETEHEPKSGLGYGYDPPVKGIIIKSLAGMHGGLRGCAALLHSQMACRKPYVSDMGVRVALKCV